MALSRVLIITFGVLLHFSRCARLKRTATQRRLATAAAASSHTINFHAETGPVADNLKARKEQIASLIDGQHEFINRCRRDITHREGQVAQLKREISQIQSWWRVWNHVSPWKDEVRRRQELIRRLEQDKHNLENSIKSAEEEMETFEGAMERTHDAHERAQVLEAHVEFLNDELAPQKQRHVNLLSSNQQIQRQERGLSDDKLRRMQDELDVLHKQYDNANQELQNSKDGKLELQAQWQATKTQLQEIIAAHQTRIDNLEALIGDNDRRIDEVKRDRAEAKIEYEESLAKLRADREAAEKEKHELTKQMEEHIAELADVTAQGEAKIADMIGMLQKQIKDLEHDIEKQKQLIENERQENEVRISGLRAEHETIIENLDEEIQTHQAAKISAQDALKALKDTHAMIVAGHVAVSEALRKAKSGLEGNLTKTETEYHNASTSIKGQQVQLREGKADKQSRSKWYNSWWYSLTGAIASIDKDIKSTAHKINVLEASRRGKQHQIQELKEQIDSKHDGVQAAARQEENIRTHESQIGKKTSDRASRVKAQSHERDKVKAEGNGVVMALRTLATGLETEESEATEELEALKDDASGHTLHVELQLAEDALQKAIDSRNASIAILKTTIADKKSAEDELMEKEKRDLAEHDQTLADLQAHASNMTAHKAFAEQAKRNENARLEDLKSEKDEQVDIMQTSIRALKDSIADLNVTIAESEKDLQDEKIDSDEFMRELAKKHSREAAAVSEEIALLSSQKANAEQSLEDIKWEHLHPGDMEYLEGMARA